MQQRVTLPHTAEDLIEYLDGIFPDKCAGINETERQIFIRTGQRLVVEHLRDLQERTEEMQTRQSLENT